MSDAIDKLRKKLAEKQEELKVEQKITEKVEKIVEAEPQYTQVVYDVIPDPKKNGRHFLILKIRYNLESREAVVEEVKPLRAKPVGFKSVDNKKDLEYIFNKSKKE